MKKRHHRDQISIVDLDAVVDGTLNFKGVLVVRGTVKGFLEAEEVIVAEEGTVSADLRAERVTLKGTFQGRLRVSGDLNILAGGMCFGKVNCRNLVVEAGGILNADVTYGSRKGAGEVVDTEERLIDRVVHRTANSAPLFHQVVDLENEDEHRGLGDGGGDREPVMVIKWPVGDADRERNG